MDGMKAKAIRCYLGVSMDSFAKRLGVGTTTIHAIENGQREISDYVRAKLIRLETQLPDDFIVFYEIFKSTA